MFRITVQQDNASGCFEFQSHGNGPTSILCSMYNNDKCLSDVSLTGAAPTGGACDLQPIRAHKLILAPASPHLYDLFTVQGFKDSNGSAYPLTTIDHDSLRSIVKFVYTDKLEVEEDGAVERVRSILIGAKYLIMKELAEACEGFLASSDRIDVNNCIDGFQFAFKYNCVNLLSGACAFIAKNLLAVSQSIKFLGLTQDECAKFLLSEPVVAANADDRCRAAIAWLNHQSPSRAASAECIMSMAALDAAGVKPETLLLAAQSVVIRPTIKGFVLTLVDALASNVHRLSQVEPEQKNQKLEEARGEAWYIVGSPNDRKGFYRYDVAGRQWSSLPELPWYRERAGVCAVGKRLIVMGGRKRGHRVSQIDEYDTMASVDEQIWSTSKAKFSGPKERLVAAAYGRYAYAFGGCSFGTICNDAKRYRVGTDSLASLADMPAVGSTDGREGAACKSEEVVFVAGGRTKPEDGGQGDLRTIIKYDYTFNKWTEITKLEKSHVGSGVAFVGDDFYPERSRIGALDFQQISSPVVHATAGLCSCMHQSNTLHADPPVDARTYKRVYLHASTLIRERSGYIAGGYKSKQVEIFNAETGQLRRCAARLSDVREGCSAVPLDQHVVCVVGGYGSVEHSSVEVYDTRDGKWSTGVVVPDMPKACSYFGFAHVRL